MFRPDPKASGVASWQFAMAAGGLIGATTGAVVGGVSAYVNGGNIGAGVGFGALIGGITGAASGAVFHGVSASLTQALTDSLSKVFVNVTAGSIAGIPAGAISGAGQGAIQAYAGGTGSVADVFMGAARGAITGAATGAAIGGLIGGISPNYAMSDPAVSMPATDIATQINTTSISNQLFQFIANSAPVITIGAINIVNGAQASGLLETYGIFGFTTGGKKIGGPSLNIGPKSDPADPYGTHFNELDTSTSNWGALRIDYTKL